MTPLKFFETYDKQRSEQVALAAGTTYANFQQIARYAGSCSRALAGRLQESSNGEMTRDEILYPDDYEEDDTAA